MNGFLIGAIAHDATCEPGEEWLFHGMAQPHEDVYGASTVDQKDKNLLDKDMDELRKHYEEEDDEVVNADFTTEECLMAIVFVVSLLGIAVWALCF